jgi:hypothetical protein
MKIGIDISQLVFQNTGVANYLLSLVENMLSIDSKNEYKLFFASMRGNLPKSKFWTADGKIISDKLPKGSSVSLSQFKIAPTILDILWNRLHIVPIEKFIGDVDVFITSDWTEPPTKKAKKATILYDLVVFKNSSETDKKIIDTQKRKLKWVKKESSAVICISEATKKDAEEVLNIPKEKLFVVYPGF